MNDDAKVVNIFERHAITATTPSLVTEAKGVGATEYRAYEVEKTARQRVEWLDIRLVDGTCIMLPYHLLTEVYLSSHQHLSLIYASGVVTLIGRRLEEVKTLIQRGHLLAVTCFDPQRHAPPGESGAVITSITRQTMRELAGG
jgi:hypothetical protein